MGMDNVLGSDQRVTFNPTAGIQPMLQTFDASQNSAALPQKLLYDAIMNKVNLARSSNPIDMALIQHLSGQANQNINDFMSRNGGGAPQTGGSPGGQIGPQNMIQPDGPPAPIRSKGGQVTGTRMPAPVASLAPQGIGPDQMLAQYIQSQGGQPGGQPQAPQQQAPDMSGMMSDPSAPAQAPIMASSPTSLQDFANTIDLTKIPSTATEETAKMLLANQAMMNRYLPSSQARITSDENNNQTKTEIAGMNNNSRETVQGMKNSVKTASYNAPYDDTQVSDFIHKTFSPFDAPGAMYISGNAKKLAAKIDNISDPQLKIAAMNIYGDAYRKYKQLSPVAPAPAPTPPANPTSPPVQATGPSWPYNTTPQSEANAQHAVDGVSNLLAGLGKQTIGADGLPKYVVPADKLNTAIKKLKAYGASPQQIQKIQNQFVPAGNERFRERGG